MEYDEFRRKLTHNVEEKIEWRDLATFVPNKTLSIYNWFYFKEGFSKQLVDILIDMLGIKKGDTVLDPFCGSGTTLLACKQRGINAVGLDVLPTAVFASAVKTDQYDVNMLKEEAKILFRRKFYRLNWEFPKIMKSMINKYALEDIAFFSSIIDNLENKDFFALALMTASIRVSYAWKDGGVIKIKKHPVPPLRKLFQRTVYRMIKDIESSEPTGVSALILQCDARQMKLNSNSVDAIITSPPYLNNIDYTKIYAIEDFFMKMRHVPTFRSFLGIREDKDQEKAYFDDMASALGEMHRVCKPGAHVAIVIGNAYIDGEVESDFIISYLASKVGFEVEKILVLNKRFALENRTTKKGMLRESLIILKKK